MGYGDLFRKQYNGIYLSDVVIPVVSFAAAAFVFSLERALLIGFLIGSLSVVMNMKWHLRSASWFWLILTLFFVLNAVLIFAIPMPREFKMAAAFTPLVILEGLALLGIIGLIERRMKRVD